MKYEVRFSQTVIKDWMITVEANSAKEAIEKVKTGDCWSTEELVGESDEGLSDFEVQEVISL